MRSFDENQATIYLTYNYLKFLKFWGYLIRYRVTRRLFCSTSCLVSNFFRSMRASDELSLIFSLLYLKYLCK